MFDKLKFHILATRKLQQKMELNEIANICLVMTADASRKSTGKRKEGDELHNVRIGTMLIFFDLVGEHLRDNLGYKLNFNLGAMLEVFGQKYPDQYRSMFMEKITLHNFIILCGASLVKLKKVNDPIKEKIGDDFIQELFNRICDAKGIDPVFKAIFWIMVFTKGKEYEYLTQGN